MSTSKAQTLTYDFFIALSIFFLVFLIILSYWYYSSVQMQEVIEKNRAANELFLASDVWFKEGYPKYWGAENVLEMGFSNGNEINRTKMEMLPSIGYPKLVSLLNLGTFNIQYTVYNTTRDVIFQFPSSADFSSAGNVYKIERIGLIGDQPVKIRTVIWE